MMFGIGGMSTGLMIAFGLGRVALFALLIYTVYRIMKKRKVNHDPALQQLKMKYVNGEISQEEYQSKADFFKKVG